MIDVSSGPCFPYASVRVDETGLYTQDHHDHGAPPMIMSGRIPSVEELESIRSVLSQEPPEEEADASLSQLIQTLGSLDNMASALDTKLDGLLSSLDDILKGLGPVSDASAVETRSGSGESENEDAPQPPPPTESSVAQEAEQSSVTEMEAGKESASVSVASSPEETTEKARAEDGAELSNSDIVPPQTMREQGTLPADTPSNDEGTAEADA